MRPADYPSQIQSSRAEVALFAVTLGAILALFASLSTVRIWAHDFWWQYATGRLVSQSGPPHTDVFSYTVRGMPWIELRWLYCWLLYLAYEHMGPAVVSLAACALPAIAFALLVAPVLRPPRIAAAAITLFLAVIAASPRMLVRPELITYVLIAVYLRIVDRHRRQGGRLIYAIPAIQVIWVNSHTLFAIGPGLVGLLLVEMLIRRLLRRPAIPDAQHVVLALALSIVACVANPYGAKSIPFALQLLHQIHGTVYKEAILEFRSPFAYGPTFTAVLAFQLLLALTLAGVLANLRRLDAYWTLLTLVMAYLAAVSIRNVPLFCLVTSPYTISNLQQSPWWTTGSLAGLRKPLGVAVSLSIVASSLFVAQRAATNRFLINENDPRQFGVGMAQHHDPADATRALLDTRPVGHVFSTFAESPYLIANGIQVFTDGRLEVYGPGVFKEYLGIVDSEVAWRDADRKFEFQAALINLESRLISQLWADPHWQLIAFDEVAAVFVRVGAASPTRALRSAADFAAVVERLRRTLPSPPTFESLGLMARATSPLPYQRLGVFLLALGFPQLAEPFLEDAIHAFPDAALAHKYRGQVRESRGDWNGAIADYQLALQRLPDDPDLLLQLANLYMTAAQPDKARPLVARALLLAPQNPRAWALQAALRAAENRWPEAAQCMQKAVELDPANNNFRTFLEVIRKNVATR